MHRRNAAGIRMGRPRPIDFLLQPACQRLRRRRVGPRATGRRHRASAKFADDFLPDLGIGADMIEVERVEGESGGFESLIVAAETVLFGNGAVRLAARRSGRNDWRLLCSLGPESACHGRKPDAACKCNRANNLASSEHLCPPHWCAYRAVSVMLASPKLAR